MDDCDSLWTIVCANGRLLFCRTTFLSKRTEPFAASLDQIFTDYVLHGQVAQVETVVTHVLEMPEQSLKEQVSVWGSVSNFHWWSFITQYGGKKSTSTTPKYPQFLLFNPAKGAPSPTSPRNILMHCLPFLSINDENPGSELKFMQNLLKLVKYDQEEEESLLANSQQNLPPPQPTDEIETDAPPAPKKRKYTTRVIPANPEELFEGFASTEEEVSDAVKSSVPHRTQFDLFCEKLHTDGLIQWRKHDDDVDVVVMNDYSSTSGELKPLDFVHVTATKTDSSQVQVKCTCSIYKSMQGKALEKAHMENSSDTVLPSHFTCMHCRFYSSFLLPVQASLLTEDSVSKLHDKVKETLKNMNNPIVLLGVASQNTTTKFSVLGEESLALVHVHFLNSGCFVRCLEGLCSAKYTIKKRVPCGIPLKDLPQGQVCPHLQAVLFYTNILEETFPLYFKNNDPTLDTEQAEQTDEVPTLDVINNDDIEVRDFDPGTISFDIHEGKWKVKSHSNYQPRAHRYDPALVTSTQQRLQHCQGEVNSKGCYKGPDLFPIKPACVECGEQFSETSDAAFRTVSVYSRNVSYNRPFYYNNRPLTNHNRPVSYTIIHSFVNITFVRIVYINRPL